jgi:hypothetical protein
MNKICKLSAVALLASSTSLMAQSKSFEGASLAIAASAVGVEVDGNTKSGTNVDSTSASIGKIAEIASIDLAYTFSLSPNGAIAFGATYTPGKAKAGSGTYTDASNTASATPAVASVSGTSGSVNVQVKDPYTIYVAPTYAISKDSALYAKLGYSKADVNVSATGSAVLTKKPDDLEGFTYAIGSKTMLTPNFYIGVEASVTDYDSISATRATTTPTVSTTNISADVKAVQATVAIGYKF